MIKFVDIQSFIKIKFQTLSFIWKPATSVFLDIYYTNRWGNRESISGPGSDINQTLKLVDKIPNLIKEINVKTLVDAPCGDFNWMKRTSLVLDRYIGIDIVPDLINQNEQKWGNEIRQFLCSNIIEDDLPQVDLILCRDCLVHFSFNNIISTIRNFKRSNSVYLLTTTYPELLKKNRNIITGSWRPIDLELPPFNFPKPITIINEECTFGGDFPEKSLGLWKLEDIQI